MSWPIDFLKHRGWLGLVQRNSSTGILSVGGTDLLASNVDTSADLAALNTTTYDKQRVMVNNPGGQVGYGFGTVAGIPAPAYCYNGAWHWENGIIILGIYAEGLQLTAPAATFTSPAVVNNAGLVKLDTSTTSLGVHGLTAANALTGVFASKVRILSGTNWTPGDYDITAITLDTTGTDFTINYPYSAGLGSPTLALAHATTEREIARLKVPIPLTNRARILIDGGAKTPVAAAGAMRLKFYLGSTAEDYSTAGLISNFNYGTNVTIASFHTGVQLQNSKTVQRGIYQSTGSTGYGTTTTGDTANLTETMTSSTDIIVTALLETADRPFRFGSIIWSMIDA